MALPKRRHSATRGRKRRTHWKIALPGVQDCPRCSQPKLPHRICANCGFYRGEEVIAPKES